MALDDVDLQDQAVQYVLGELPAADARALEQRMTSDAALAVEVRRLRATLGLLPYATSPSRRPALRAQSALRKRGRGAAARHPGTPRPAAPSGASSRPPSPRRSRSPSGSTPTTRQELAMQQQVAQLLLEPNVVRTFEWPARRRRRRPSRSTSTRSAARSCCVAAKPLPPVADLPAVGAGRGSGRAVRRLPRQARRHGARAVHRADRRVHGADREALRDRRAGAAEASSRRARR